MHSCRKRKGGGGFTKLVRLSPALSTFLGVDEESRPQVVKKLWAYIKENNLQASASYGMMATCVRGTFLYMHDGWGNRVTHVHALRRAHAMLAYRCSLWLRCRSRCNSTTAAPAPPTCHAHMRMRMGHILGDPL